MINIICIRNDYLGNDRKVYSLLCWNNDKEIGICNSRVAIVTCLGGKQSHGSSS